jgi:hypothetical protein
VVESKARALLRELVCDGGLPAAAPAGLALPDLAAAAAAQGLSGLLLAALERGEGAWAESLRDGLVRERRSRLTRTLSQVSLLARTAAELEAHGIRTLPLKGAVLAESVYDVESDRPMSDVDLLALERWRGGLDHLAAGGFTVLSQGDHAWAMRDPGSGQVLELHRSVTSAPGLFPLDPEALWSRRRPGRAQLRSWPSPEDLLLQLALHASFQHGLVLSLVQWLDFRRVLERERLDVARLRALAEEARAEVPLAAALVVARAVAGAPVPGELVEPVRLPHALGARLRRLVADPLAAVAPAPAELARVRFELLAGRRAALLWRTVVLPDTPSGRTGLPARLVAALRRAGHLAGALGAQGLSPAPGASAVAPPPPLAPAGAPLSEQVLRDCLSSHPHVAFTVSGHCMAPALRDGERVHLVGPQRRAPRVGDVVLARQKEGLRLHRLVWGPPLARRGAAWRTKADRGRLLDPPLRAEDVLGTVSLVEGREEAAPRRAGLALASLAAAVAFRVRHGARPAGAEALP